MNIRLITEASYTNALVAQWIMSLTTDQEFPSSNDDKLLCLLKI